MNKYPLMGRYVEVKEYLKPANKFSARSHEPVVLKEPRVGMVVGYRTVYDGKIHPGSGGSYDNPEDYTPAWFEVEGKIPVILVSFWPTYKPVLVKPENIGFTILVPDNSQYHPTSYKWKDKDKEYLRDIMRAMPRDEKGRWKK